MISVGYLVPVQGLWSAMFVAYIGMFLVCILLTNQFHSWAHATTPARWIRALQRAGLIRPSTTRATTPRRHTYYCITCGSAQPDPRQARLLRGDRRSRIRRVLEPLAGKADEVDGVED